MAFISLIFVAVPAILIILFLGISPVVIGTIVYNKTEHKKIGVILKIWGYIILIPSVIIGILLSMILFNKL